MSPLYWFFVLNKKGENICLLLPLCWWLTKRGRRIWVCSLYACLCMHVFMFYYVLLKFNWYHLICSFLVSRASLVCFARASLVLFCKLVSRACFENVLVLFNWYQEHVLEIYVFYACWCIHVYEHSLHTYLFILMHELRGSFLEA